MKDSKKLKKIKAENFAIIVGGTSSGMILAFIWCWSVPVATLFYAQKACKSANSKKERLQKFSDAYLARYCESINGLAEIPFITYYECKKHANQRLQDFYAKQRN